MRNIHPAPARRGWVHMMGIGGIGMSAIARLLLERGEKVTGCDTCLSPLTEKLKNMGAVIYNGHSPFHIDDSVSLVVHSSAIKSDNPELARARGCSIPVIRRAQMLAEVIKDKSVIAVTGTHGKTTTSFMIAHIMDYAGLEPSFAIGGEMEHLGGNARWGGGRYFVAETDESDGTQLCIKPDIAVITNIDCDHMENYRDISHIAEIMKEFIDKTHPDGLAVGCGDDTEINKILKNVKIPKLTYGWDLKNDIYPEDIELSTWSSRFNLWHRGRKLGIINLNIPGQHNILNAMASVGVCIEAGVSFNKIAEALNTYSGVKRRLDVVFRNDEVTVMDDYAHHPNEIRAVINTVRRSVNGRLIGIFQPHRFTRTKFLSSDFGKCFSGLDRLILTDIYSAGDPPIPGISGRVIYDEVLKYGEPRAVYIESKDNIMEYLLPQIQKGDTILFMGAGDITEVAHSEKWCQVCFLS